MYAQIGWAGNFSIPRGFLDTVAAAVVYRNHSGDFYAVQQAMHGAGDVGMMLTEERLETVLAFIRQPFLQLEAFTAILNATK